MFKFESKFKPLPTCASCLAISANHSLKLFKSTRESKDLTAKLLAKLLGQRSATAWAGRLASTNTGYWQSLQAATCLLEENVLPRL